MFLNLPILEHVSEPHPFSGILCCMSIPHLVYSFISWYTAFALYPVATQNKSWSALRAWSRSPGPLRPSHSDLTQHTFLTDPGQTNCSSPSRGGQWSSSYQRQRNLWHLETDTLAFAFSFGKERMHVVRKMVESCLGNQGGEKEKQVKGGCLWINCTLCRSKAKLYHLYSRKQINTPKTGMTTNCNKGGISEIQEGSRINHQEKQVHFYYSVSSYPLSQTESRPYALHDVHVLIPRTCGYLLAKQKGPCLYDSVRKLAEGRPLSIIQMGPI